MIYQTGNEPFCWSTESAVRYTVEKSIAIKLAFAERIHVSKDLFFGMDETSHVQAKRQIGEFHIGGVDAKTGEYWVTLWSCCDLLLGTTAEVLFSYLELILKNINELKQMLKLPPTHMFQFESLSTDNCPTMSGEFNGVYALFKQARLDSWNAFKNQNPATQLKFIPSRFNGCRDHQAHMFSNR